MDLGVNLLLGLTGLIFVVIVGLLIWTGIAYEEERNSNNQPKAPCQGTNLVVIPDDAPRCKIQGRDTSYYYLGLISNGRYDLVVAPFARAPLDVCIQFCCSYDKGMCTGPDYGGQTAQANFDRCMSQLTPTDCIPPLPIARKGSTLYYAYSPTCSTCDGCSTGVNPCGKIEVG